MNYQAQQNELRDRLAEFSRRIQAAVAQGLTDLPKLSENLVAALMKELLDFRSIRNLNAEEKTNFPGIDLADDERRIAVQVTATASLHKIKTTIATVLRHSLETQYPRVILFVLTEKQATYSQSALDTACAGRIEFLAGRDVLDYRDLLRAAATAHPVALQRALDAFRAYDTGVSDVIATCDFDPPVITEEALINLVELYLPKTLYVADLVNVTEVRRIRNQRKGLRGHASTLGRVLPSGYEVQTGQLLTFINLADSSPFNGLFDPGTLTPLSPAEFASVDDANNRVLKSLLRLTLQQQLYQQKVKWLHDERLFCFMPESEDALLREVRWKDQRQAKRTLYKPMPARNEYPWTTYRHFSFEVDFLELEGAWFALLRPDWYYSTGPSDFRKSPGAEVLSAGLKRLGNNQALHSHFRFLCHWLRSIETADLLACDASAGRLSFGEGVVLDGHRCLDDSRWTPLKTNDSPPDEHDNRLALEWQ
jgi:hypothetical protein